METPLPALGQLAEALSKAQAEIKTPLKNREVDYTDKQNRRVKYSYADLADVIDCVRAPLSKHGLAVVHQLEVVPDGFGLKTSLIHSSGERISAWYPLPDPTQLRPQEFGSAITYARRYSLSALIGIASEEDDDGADAPPASGPHVPKPKAPEVPKPTPAPKVEQPEDPARLITNQEREKIATVASQNEWTVDQVKRYMKRKFSVESSKDLNLAQFQSLIKTIWEMKYEAGPDSDVP